MSLKDRLKGKKEAKLSVQAGEYKISVKKIADAISTIKNPADLGNIVKELAKFLKAMDARDAQIVLKGDFDLGQKTLLNCVLANFLDNSEYFLEDEEDVVGSSAPKLIRKRKSVKARLAEELDD